MIVCNICKKKITDDYMTLDGNHFGHTESDPDLESEMSVEAVFQELRDAHFHVDCLCKLLRSDFAGFDLSEDKSDDKVDHKSEKKKKNVKQKDVAVQKPAPDWKKAEQQYADGISISEIAKSMGLSYNHVWKHFDVLKKKADSISDGVAAATASEAGSDNFPGSASEEAVMDAALSEPVSDESVSGESVGEHTEVDAVTDAADNIDASNTSNEQSYDPDMLELAGKIFDNSASNDEPTVDPEIPEMHDQKPAVKDQFEKSEKQVPLSELDGDAFAKALSAFRDPMDEIKHYYPKRPGSNSRVDVGKVFALHKASWSDDEIANEVHISVDMVERVLSDERFRSVFLKK